MEYKIAQLIMIILDLFSQNPFARFAGGTVNFYIVLITLSVSIFISRWMLGRYIALIFLATQIILLTSWGLDLLSNRYYYKNYAVVIKIFVGIVLSIASIVAIYPFAKAIAPGFKFRYFEFRLLPKPKNESSAAMREYNQKTEQAKYIAPFNYWQYMQSMLSFLLTLAILTGSWLIAKSNIEVAEKRRNADFRGAKFTPYLKILRSVDSITPLPDSSIAKIKSIDFQYDFFILKKWDSIIDRSRDSFISAYENCFISGGPYIQLKLRRDSFLTDFINVISDNPPKDLR